MKTNQTINYEKVLEEKKWTELSFIEGYLDKIREGKETPFGGEVGTGAWFKK